MEGDQSILVQSCVICFWGNPPIHVARAQRYNTIDTTPILIIVAAFNFFLEPGFDLDPNSSAFTTRPHHLFLTIIAIYTKSNDIIDISQLIQHSGQPHVSNRLIGQCIRTFFHDLRRAAGSSMQKKKKTEFHRPRHIPSLPRYRRACTASSYTL